MRREQQLLWKIILNTQEREESEERGGDDFSFTIGFLVFDMFFLKKKKKNLNFLNVWVIEVNGKKHW